jgi:aspartate aminotransferase
MQTVQAFDNIPLAPPDIIFNLTNSYKADTFPKKVNLGVGAYRDHEGKPWVLPVVRQVRLTYVLLLSSKITNHME